MNKNNWWLYVISFIVFIALPGGFIVAGVMAKKKLAATAAANKMKAADGVTQAVSTDGRQL
jgi:hypothetical protein